MYDTDKGTLQYGPAMSASAVIGHMASGLQADLTKGVTVEVITSTPYTNVLGVVTAVGGKYGDVLLTVEPQNQPTKDQRVASLSRLLLEQLPDLHPSRAEMMAVALIDKGVLPTRDW